MGRIPFYKQGDKYNTVDRRWDVAIYQTADTPWTVEDLDFDADPLTIEWDDCAPEDVIEGSTATLRVISPSDRKYIDLYTTDPLGVTVEISAGSKVVWRGALEPELYEEPYSTARGYTVELSFADIAAMERIDFNLAGNVTLDDIVKAAVFTTALTGYSLKTSTRVHNWATGTQEPVSLSKLCISADNFYDEDGSPMTMREAVETILRPLGLHLRQQGGVLWIYDWHILATEAPTAIRVIDWTSTDSALSVAPVAHKVTLTYSPYADTTLADGSLAAADVPVAQTSAQLRIWTDDGTDIDNRIHGFYIYSTSGVPSGITLPAGLSVTTDLWRIVAGHSGNDSAGVFGMARTVCQNGSRLAGGCGVTECYPQHLPVSVSSYGRLTPDYSKPAIGKEIMTLMGPWLQTPANSIDYRIKLTLDFLLDTRANPFEQADRRNEKGHWEDLQNWANFGYIPCALEILDDSGTPIYHYSNADVMKSDSRDYSSAGWSSGAATPGDMWLAYYDVTNRKSASGWGGWKKNRQCIGYWRGDLPALYEKQGEGEFIAWPSAMTAAGRLRFTIYSGIHWFDYARLGQSSGEKDLLSRINWVLYGAPKMEIVRADGSAIPTEDIIYTATAIAGAASDVKVTLKAGSVTEAPTARAVISTCAINRTDISPVGPSTFARTRTARIEELLLDTLVSQYDQPHTVLSGEASLNPLIAAEPHAWIDNAQPSGRLFIPTAACVNAIAGTADITFREISPDQYTPVE